MTYDNWIKVNPEELSLKDIITKKKKHIVANDSRRFEYETFGLADNDYRLYEDKNLICEATNKHGIVINSQWFSDFGNLDYVIFRGYKAIFHTSNGTIEIVKSKVKKLFSNKKYDLLLDTNKVGEIDLKTGTTFFSSKLPTVFVAIISAQIIDWEGRKND